MACINHKIARPEVIEVFLLLRKIQHQSEIDGLRYGAETRNWKRRKVEEYVHRRCVKCRAQSIEDVIEN